MSATEASVIRAYLEAKAALPEREWLRREPRTTHPAILEAVRAAIESGHRHDDLIERYVEDVAGDLPEHHHHSHEQRHRLTYQLGHEVYLAKGLLDDERNRTHAAEAQSEGYAPLESVNLVDGDRYVIRTGVLYVGQSEPEYGTPCEVRAKWQPAYNRFVFLPKGARTRYFVPSGAALIRHA